MPHLLSTKRRRKILNVLGQGVVEAVTPLILDNVSGGYSAYGLRKVLAGYGGNCLRVRRSNDNAEQDFGFVGTALDTDGILSFCGANDGFVTDIYDLLGNGRTLRNTTASAQPQIVSAGALLTDANGNTVIRFDGVNDILIGSTAADWTFLSDGSGWTCCMVVSTVNANPEDWWDFYSTRDNTNVQGYGLFYDDRSASSRTHEVWVIIKNATGNVIQVIGPDNSIAGATVVNITVDFEHGIGGDDGEFWANSVSIQSAESTGTPSASAPNTALAIGGRKGTKWGNFNFNELIVFNSRLADGDRTTVESDQQTGWGIP